MMNRKLPPALKHAVYSELDVLPGEDPAAFQKLRRDVHTELAIAGPLETHIADQIVRLIWRYNNLVTYRIAAAVRARDQRIRSDATSPFLGAPELLSLRPINTAELKKAYADAHKQAVETSRKELGDLYSFVEHDSASCELLEKELDLIDRLNASIGRLFKQLLHLRGVKSFSAPAIEPTARRKLPMPARTKPSENAQPERQPNTRDVKASGGIPYVR